MDFVDRDLLLWPIAVHFAIILCLYGWLSLVRKWQRDGGPVDALESRVSANLSNQFEAPVLFHILVAILWSADMVKGVDLALGWIFVFGRILHTLVQGLTPNVIARGLVYMISFGAIMAMWALFFWGRLIG